MNNVVIICLDTVRKDFFDKNAPMIRELSDVEFDQMRSVSAWSVPSHASMLTGTLPSKHGLSTYQRSFDGLNEATFLDDLDGYTCYGTSANMFASSAYGFDRFFDTFTEVSPRRRFIDGLEPMSYRTDGQSEINNIFSFLHAAANHNHTLQSLGNGVVGVIKKIVEQLKITDPFDAGAKPALKRTQEYIKRDEPSVTFLNLMDAHLPLHCHRGMENIGTIPSDWSSLNYDIWDLMEDPGNNNYWETRKAIYAAAIRYLDSKLVQFVREIQNSTARETVVIVTADHGENLGYSHEDYLVNHTSSLSEGLLHVPFVVITEEDTTIKQQSGNYTTLLDLPYVVQGAISGSIPDIGRNRVVGEVLGRGPTPDPPSREPYWNRAIRCAYKDKTKIIWDSLGNRTRYRLDYDHPSWHRRITRNATVPTWASDIFSTAISELPSNSVSGDEVAATTKQRLKKLGYL